MADRDGDGGGEGGRLDSLSAEPACGGRRCVLSREIPNDDLAM